MDERTQEHLLTLAAEYGIPGTDSTHFALDTLDRYPGPLPFDLAPVSNNPADASTHLDPDLVAAIVSDLERARTAPSADDSLERLAQQLDSLSIPPPSASTPLTPEEPGSAIPPSSDEPIEPEPEHAEASSDSEPEPPPVRRRSVGRLVVLIVLCLLVVTGAVLFFMSRSSHHSPATFRADTTTAGIQPTPEPAAQTTPPPASLDTLSGPEQIVAVEHESTTVRERSVPATPSDTTARLERPSRRAAAARSREPREPDVTIVSPPSLPPPPSTGTFTIQVCSSPSYAEAMRWKTFIEERGNHTATIVRYRMREQTYYRVRVGTFHTADQAREAAMELGLNPAAVWIVRIE
ncbi:MAG: hypothetical protein KatS3mg039_0979 [Candidatus Kapaibacterium sp.]|nr:MAG: hypothetical protein KatS3mg039_0979 [Candidatus Kapabacteria bacterium]